MKLSHANEDLLTRAILDSDGREICAFLLSNLHGGQEIFRIPNLEKEPDAFFIARSDLQRVERYANRGDYKILAFIHSHTSSLELSKEDCKNLECSKYPWMVISLSTVGLSTRLYKKSVPYLPDP